MDLPELRALAELIRRRNENEVAISRVIRRPALLGHIGRYVASQIFDIALGPANQKGMSGRFRSGPLAGRSVVIKTYGKREGVLDINPESPPDFYLVLAGPKATAANSKDVVRPWGIKEVFLFEAHPLIARLRERKVRSTSGRPSGRMTGRVPGFSRLRTVTHLKHRNLGLAKSSR